MHKRSFMNKKPLLCALFALLLVFTILTVTVSTGDGNFLFSSQTALDTATISAVDVTVTAPVNGQAPSYEAVVPADAGYQLVNTNTDGWKNGVLWKEEESNTTLDPDTAKFEAGKQYRVQVWLERTGSNYEFSTGLTAKVNNVAAITSAPHGSTKTQCIVKNIFTCGTSGFLSRVDIMIAEPKAGKHPSFFAISKTEGCLVEDYTGKQWHHGVNWYDDTDKLDLTPEDTFAHGHGYRVSLRFAAQTGYEFSYEETKVYINGVEADRFSDGYAYDFPVTVDTALKIVGRVDISLDEPKVGAHPDFSPTVSGDGCKIDSFSGMDGSRYRFYNGVAWNRNYSPEYVFEGGETYSAVIRPVAEEGYRFYFGNNAEARTEFYINGKKINSAFPDNEQYPYLATQDYALKSPADQSAKIIGKVDISVAPPVIGESPVAPVLADNTKCSLYFNETNGTGWYDADSGDDIRDAFLSGAQYGIRAVLTPADGYRFYFGNEEETKTEIYINGVKVVVDTEKSTEKHPVAELVFPRLSDLKRVTLTCFIKSYQDSSDGIKFELLQGGKVQYSYDVPGDFDTVKQPELLEGNYLLRVSRNGVVREKEITVSGNTDVDVWLYKIGDVDGDGEITSLDATYIQRSCAYIKTGIEGNVLMNGDVDDSGELGISDATFIQRFLAFMDTPFTIGE